MAAASAFVLTGCTESDLSSDTSLAKESAPSAIEFSAKTRNAGATRTTGGAPGDITTTVLKGENYGFGVVAYMKGADGVDNCYNDANPPAWNTSIPNFMWNQKVYWNVTTNNTWTYSPVKFWPNDFSTGNVDDKEGTGEDKEAWGSRNAGKVSFFAYAPYVNFPAESSGDTEKHGKKNVSEKSPTADTDGIVAMTANNNNGEPQVYYVLSNADVDHAVDLLWGLRGNSSGYSLANNTEDATKGNDYNINLTKQSVGESVNFLFKHALSKLGGHTPNDPTEAYQTGLQIVLDVDNGSENGGVKPGTAISGGVKQANTLVTVEKIEIYDKATASASPVDPVIYNTTQTSDLIKSGWFNIATGAWDLTTSTTKGATYSSVVDNNQTVSGNGYALNANIKEATPTADVTGTTFNNWKISDAVVTGVTTTPQDVYTNDSDVPSLVLIPSSTEAQTLVVRIKYIVRTWDPNLNVAASGEPNGTWTKVTQTITNEVTIPAGALKSNKYYKLLIHLGLTSVKFTASVVDWEEAAGSSTSGTDNADENFDKDVYLPSNTLTTTTEASTETVTSATVIAGTSKTFSAPAANGDFTINLQDIDTNTSALGVTVTGATNEQKSGSPSYTAGESTGTVTVTLPENTHAGETQTTTVTIASTGASPSQSTVVTIVQVAP